MPFATGPIAAAAAADDWERIARQYDVTREVIQLEHGNWGMMAKPVLAAPLRDRWVHAPRVVPQVQVLTPDDR